MEIGFETIGNATVTCFDRSPVLCTDPWISDSAYFGSWTLSHEIPKEQLEHIHASKFVWFSHGHPDHLNPDCHPLFLGKQILLADHVGNRLRDGLSQSGHNVRVLPDRKWVDISENIKILSIADFNQDSILLIDINGRLLVNLNDAGDRGWGRTVKKIIRQYPISILLKLFGYGDADMINYYDEDGKFILPKASRRIPVGNVIENVIQDLGCRMVIPFSSLHQYQREDSVWANEYTTPLEAFGHGFGLEEGRLLPAFIRFDCMNDTYTEISPPKRAIMSISPKEFGDNWDDTLEKSDVLKIKRYVQSVQHLSDFLDFINFRVGSKDHIVELQQKNFNTGITFEAPRQSLVSAVDYDIFDDLLIGNFMKTTLHGTWPTHNLSADFTPYVAKYADNGGARSREELEVYFEAYKKRAPIDALFTALDRNIHSLASAVIPRNTPLHRVARTVYRSVKRAL